MAKGLQTFEGSLLILGGRTADTWGKTTDRWNNSLLTDGIRLLTHEGSGLDVNLLTAAFNLARRLRFVVVCLSCLSMYIQEKMGEEMFGPAARSLGGAEYGEAVRG